MAVLIPFLTLFALWLLLSGMFDALQIGLGLVSCALVVWLAFRLQLLGDSPRLHMALRCPGYAVWLAREIVISNLHVARVVLAPRMRLQRQVLRVPPSQRTGLGVATYANSITLTPGTLTLDADDDELVVHALTQQVADDLTSGEMDRRVSALEPRD